MPSLYVIRRFFLITCMFFNHIFLRNRSWGSTFTIFIMERNTATIKFRITMIYSACFPPPTKTFWRRAVQSYGESELLKSYEIIALIPFSVNSIIATNNGLKHKIKNNFQIFCINWSSLTNEKKPKNIRNSNIYGRSVTQNFPESKTCTCTEYLRMVYLIRGKIRCRILFWGGRYTHSVHKVLVAQ